MSTSVIGCKLPNGIELQGPNGAPVEINGINRAPVLGTFGITRMDENLAAYLFTTYAMHSAFQSQAIFQYGDGDDSVQNLLGVANDLSDVQTGFEGADPHKPAPGLTPSDATVKDLDAAIQTGAAAVPKKAPKGGKASAAAAAELAAVQQGA